MKSKARRLISLIVTLVMTFTVMSMSMVGMTAGAAENQTYSEIKKYEVTYGGKVYRGFILVPEEEGQYDVNLIFCGTGGLNRWTWYHFDQWVNKWVSNGYIKPSIIVMPSVDKSNPDMEAGVQGWQFEQFVREQMGGMKEALLKTEYGKYINPSKQINIIGYSMGGSASLLTATLYPNLYTNVASLSPSHTYYSYDGQQWLKSAKEIVFAKSSRARRLIAYSKSESNGQTYIFQENAKRYETEARKNGYPFKTYVTKNFPHKVDIFFREIFVYMYYLDHNIVLTESRVNNMDYSMPITQYR